MKKSPKLMEMLSGYAAAHQHPFNVAVHLVGIPVIMLGVFIALASGALEFDSFTISFAQIAVIGLFLFYLSLDVIFALVFLVVGWLLALLAMAIHNMGWPVWGIIAAIAFFGGYLAQFVGHTVEKSVPVILRHPIQANLAAPFFTIVEIFHIFGLRQGLFREVQLQVDEQRSAHRR